MSLWMISNLLSQLQSWCIMYTESGHYSRAKLSAMKRKMRNWACMNYSTLPPWRYHQKKCCHVSINTLIGNINVLLNALCIIWSWLCIGHCAGSTGHDGGEIEFPRRNWKNPYLLWFIGEWFKRKGTRLWDIW